MRAIEVIRRSTNYNVMTLLSVAGHTISNITSSKFQDKPQIVSTVGLPAVSQTEQNVCDVVRAQNH